MQYNNTTKEIKMTYPGIYKATDGAIYYYLNKSTFFSPERQRWEKDEGKDDHKTDKNITADYLRNTYGKVESKEHAEFIVKLAEGAGIFVDNKFDPSIYSCHFSFHELKSRAICLGFYSRCAAASRSEKPITLPLPPKDSEEWPQVGDEVLYDGSSDRFESIKGEVSKVIAKYSFESSDYITIKHRNEGVFAMVVGSWIKKPPTPEEELRDDLIDMTIKSMSDDSYDLPHNAYYLVSALINKYDIKKKPE